MKKRILSIAAVSALALILPAITQAQTIEPCTVGGGVIDGGLGTSVVNIPYDPLVHIGGKTTSSSFHANISSYITGSHADWIDAIEKAVSTWAQILATPQHVNINFHSSNEGGSYAIPSDFLAKGTPTFDAAGFSVVGGTAAYFPATYYVGPLASFLSGGATASGALSDINVIINENYAPIHGGFNTNTSDAVACPSDKYDLMTVCMEAMGSGFGLLSEENAFGFAHTNQWPNIFEHFIHDNGTGRASGTKTYLKDLGPTPTFQGSFVTGGGSYAIDHTFSNNAYFQGPTTPLTQLYIPGIFESGRNLCYIAPPSVNTLMNSSMPTGRKVHAPSPVEVKMLNDIGWHASLSSLSGMDDITIEDGMYSVPPTVVLNIGSTYSYYIDDYGGFYGINPTTTSFRMELLDETGYVTCDYQSSAGLTWHTNPVTLPAGPHTWVRDIYGNIQGRLTAQGNTNPPLSGTPTSCTASIDIGVKAPPDEPVLQVNNIADQNGCCATKMLKFYAAGADHFQVFSREYVGGAWNTWSISSPAAGDQSYTFTGLNQTLQRQFYVIAYNPSGTSTSPTITTQPCVHILTPSPNPLGNGHNLHLETDQSFLIANVTIANAQTGNVVASIPFDGTAPSVDIDLSPYQLQPGIYEVLATPNTPFDPRSCYLINNDNFIATAIQVGF